MRYAPAVIALFAILLFGFFAGNLNQTLHQQTTRDTVQGQINLVRSKFEGAIQADLQLVRGFVATVKTEPDMSAARFDQLASSIFKDQNRLRSLAAAPDMIIKYVHPVEGNAAAVGVNYLTNVEQRPAAVMARDSHSLVLAGPVALKQGGTGFVGRFPVYIPQGDGSEVFWGLISVVIDMHKLYRDSGLLDATNTLDVTIEGIDGAGKSGTPFFNSGARELSEPVTADIMLPFGSWQLSAEPKGGWSSLPPNALFLRTVFFFVLVVVVGSLVLAGWQVGERQRSWSALGRQVRTNRIVSRRLEMAMTASRIGVWEFNAVTNELVWDERVAELYGVPQVGQSKRSFEDWKRCVHPDDLERAMRESDEAVARGAPYTSSYRIVLPDGTIRHMRTKAQPYENGGEMLLVGAEWDVSEDVMLRDELDRARLAAETKNVELLAAKDRIEHNSMHDALTGLANRRYLEKELKSARAHAPGQEIALLHMDLDRFKQINDTLGHAAGDAMLIHAAQVLRRCARPSDVIARIGGDEFVVLCPSKTSTEELEALADRIIIEMRAPVPYGEHQCRFGVSIGIAVELISAANAGDLMVNADIALYRAKAKGRDRYEFFTAALQQEIVRTKKLGDEILSGIERGEFIPYYQPQFNARTLKVVGVEALARWNHPERGLLAPGEFIKTAEELSVMHVIDRQVLEHGILDFKRWRATGVEVPRISVNVSARRIQDGDLLEGLKTLQLEPGTVAFELVESILFDEHDDMVEWNVDRIKDLGIDIEIDDFGTGYASIVSLQKLKPARLKIDRQLTAPVVRSLTQRKMISSIIDIGKALGIEIVAEGVETMEHAIMLQSIGCDILQGYALARPMSDEQFCAFMREQDLVATS
ncbi:MAG: EAL domain-containing protein [Mesorhizobium sp.]